MDRPKIPPLTTHNLHRSCEPSRLRRQLLAQVYLRVCPESRHSLPTDQTPASPAFVRGGGPSAVVAAAGA
jgi:hypothetical protein